MSTAKFEKLIDLILNEDQERAEQLFHEIVVEKSREIYENLMQHDDVDGLISEIEMEEGGAHGVMEDDLDDEGMDGMDAEGMGDDEDDMDDEEGMDDMDDEEDMDGMGAKGMGDDEEDMDDMGYEEDMDDAEGEVTKSDLQSIEDKLDEIMAEIEAQMSDSGAAEEMPDEESAEDSEEEQVMESADLKPAPKAKSEDHKSTSPVAAESGKKGPTGGVAKPALSNGSESVPTAPKTPSNPYTKGMGEVKHAGKFGNTVNGGARVGSGKGETVSVPKNSSEKSRSPVAESKKPAKKAVR